MANLVKVGCRAFGPLRSLTLLHINSSRSHMIVIQYQKTCPGPEQMALVHGNLNDAHSN